MLFQMLFISLLSSLTLREGHDFVMNVSSDRRRLHLLVASGNPTVADVVLYVIVEQNGVLRNDTDVSAQRALLHLKNIKIQFAYLLKTVRREWQAQGFVWVLITSSPLRCLDRRSSHSLPERHRNETAGEWWCFSLIQTDQPKRHQTSPALYTVCELKRFQNRISLEKDVYI